MCRCKCTRCVKCVPSAAADDDDDDDDDDDTDGGGFVTTMSSQVYPSGKVDPVIAFIVCNINKHDRNSSSNILTSDCC